MFCMLLKTQYFKGLHPDLNIPIFAFGSRGSYDRVTYSQMFVGQEQAYLAFIAAPRNQPFQSVAQVSERTKSSH